MKLLVVDDDVVLVDILVDLLTAEGHEVQGALDGLDAWEIFKVSPVDVILSDWAMPRMDGLDLCRHIRGVPRRRYPYLLLMTQNGGRSRHLEGMEAGADDFIEKPVDVELLVTRIRVAERIMKLRSEVLRLEGLLSICSYCKQIRDDRGDWVQLEQYITRRSSAQFSHGICESCYSSRVEPCLAAFEAEMKLS